VWLRLGKYIEKFTEALGLSNVVNQRATPGVVRWFTTLDSDSVVCSTPK